MLTTVVVLSTQRPWLRAKRRLICRWRRGGTSRTVDTCHDVTAGGEQSMPSSQVSWHGPINTSDINTYLYLLTCLQFLTQQ